VKVLDTTDEAYLEGREKYETMLGLKIVLRGINMPIKDAEGNVVEDEDKKIEILRGAGLTGHQFSQLVEDITNLTRWEEEKEDDFLQR
jgi:2-hydroxychromene-2-carboxylate isomerase